MTAKQRLAMVPQGLNVVKGCNVGSLVMKMFLESTTTFLFGVTQECRILERSRLVVMAEHGRARPHHIQILFRSLAKQIRSGWSRQWWRINAVQWRVMEISSSGNSTVSCKAAEGVFAVVDMGPVEAASARIDLFRESVSREYSSCL